MRLLAVLVAVVMTAGCKSPSKLNGKAHVGSHTTAGLTRSGLETPSAIKTEHKHLHHQLEAAMAAGGKTGARAKDVAAVLLPHFEEEEAFGMPPLGSLEALGRKDRLGTGQAQEAIEMAERLRREYDKMLKEHKAIVEALRKLEMAAREERKPEHAAFAEALITHAQNEEQVLYPATLVIGEYLKLIQTLDRNR